MPEFIEPKEGELCWVIDGWESWELNGNDDGVCTDEFYHEGNTGDNIASRVLIGDGWGRQGCFNMVGVICEDNPSCGSFEWVCTKNSIRMRFWNTVKDCEGDPDSDDTISDIVDGVATCARSPTSYVSF